jgi:ribosomal protein L17
MRNGRFNQRRNQMRRGAMKQVMSAMAVAAMFVSMAASMASAKGGTKPVVNTTMALVNAASVEGHELKAGEYNVSATDSMVTISKNNKVVVEAPIEWKPETGKAQYSTFVTDGSKIIEVHFGGKTQYAVLKG